MHRLHVLRTVSPLAFARTQERAGSASESLARVFVADVDGEQFDEAQRGPLPSQLVRPGMSVAAALPARIGSRLLFTRNPRERETAVWVQTDETITVSFKARFGFLAGRQF